MDGNICEESNDALVGHGVICSSQDVSVSSFECLSTYLKQSHSLCNS